jgi:hypothetical protein
MISPAATAARVATPSACSTTTYFKAILKRQVLLSHIDQSILIKIAFSLRGAMA